MAKRLRYLLKDLDVRNAKARAKPYRKADGLYLYIAPSGVKSWQFRYRHDGRPQTATLGKLSNSQGLAWARDAADAARDKAATGDHLTRAKAVAKATKGASSKNTFSAVAADWLKSEARRAKWTSDYREEVAASLRNHLAELDGLPMAEITAAIAMPHIRRVERTAPDMAKKVRQRLRGILDYAVEAGLISGNPIPAPKRRKKNATRSHLPTIVERDAVGAILRAADVAEVCRGVRRAHLLCVFTAQRISEIVGNGENVGATWDELDPVTGVWTIPRPRMKIKEAERGPHQVPIPPRLLGALREWHRADGDAASFVCPAPRGDGSITREAVEKFYRRGLNLTGKHSPHSWRTVLSTWANDAGQDADTVEAQLDHVTGGKSKAAYDRAKRLQRRANLMAWHEDALIAARDGAKILPIVSAIHRP
ncbi:MAG: integrase arm-type DNA-binding domain-containing protein [Betaproteobacteria bacterium]